MFCVAKKKAREKKKKYARATKDKNVNIIACFSHPRKNSQYRFIEYIRIGMNE